MPTDSDRSTIWQRCIKLLCEHTAACFLNKYLQKWKPAADFVNTHRVLPRFIPLLNRELFSQTIIFPEVLAEESLKNFKCCYFVSLWVRIPAVTSLGYLYPIP